MLTKQDLEAIRGIVRDEARIVVKEELKSLKKELQELKNRVEDVEIKLDEKASELSKDMFLMRAELKEEIKNLKRLVNKASKNQDSIIKFFSEEAVLIKKRLDRIEARILSSN